MLLSYYISAEVKKAFNYCNHLQKNAPHKQFSHHTSNQHTHAEIHIPLLYKAQEFQSTNKATC